METDRGKAKIFETIPNLSGSHFTIRIIIENVAPTGCESEIVGKPVRNFGIAETFGSAGLNVGKIGTKIGPLAIIAYGGCEAERSEVSRDGTECVSKGITRR